MLATAERISPKQAHEHMEKSGAMLVCAYDSDEKCRKYHLEGAVHLEELKNQEGSIARDRELIFYCA